MTRKLKKGQRIDRNPKTGTEVPNSPRRVIVFTPSAILKQRINRHSRGGVARVAATFWIYWDTFWSLLVNAVWFMTTVSHRRKRDVPFLSTVPSCHSNWASAHRRLG
jgi:integration host factor subunit alpha